MSESLDKFIADHQAREREPNIKKQKHPFRKNWDCKCMNCDSSPTVGDTGLCGPCCFGGAETAGGNW